MYNLTLFLGDSQTAAAEADRFCNKFQGKGYDLAQILAVDDNRLSFATSEMDAEMKEFLVALL